MSEDAALSLNFTASDLAQPPEWNKVSFRAYDWVNASDADGNEVEALAIPELTPPWWMDGKTLTQQLSEPWYLTQGLYGFWTRVRDWLLYPLKQVDPLTCSEAVLQLLAWDRDISRFTGEPLDLYRKRVAFAFKNAVDAGGEAGFYSIFSRLGMTISNLDERSPGIDWDIITITMEDDAQTENQDLLSTLIQHYGRTCRRYYFRVVYPPETIQIRAGHFGMSQQIFTASLE
jgi:hypothetical protein